MLWHRACVPDDNPISTSLAHAIAGLSLDRAAAELVGGLDAARIDHRLMRGPAIAAALYPDEHRPYGDIDLLVHPDDEARAWQVAESLGYLHLYDSIALSRRLAVTVAWRRISRRGRYSRTWERPHDHASLDLHVGLFGAGRSGVAVWRAFTTAAVDVALPGRTAHGLAPPALAVTIAVHAAQHGPNDLRHVDDLRRAVVQFDARTWDEAAGIAAQIACGDGFLAGLELVPEAAALAARLAPFADAPQVGEIEIASRPRLGDLARVLPAIVFPSPALHRHESTLAGSGALGLIVSYPARLVRKALRLPSLARRGRGFTPAPGRLRVVGSLADPRTARAAAWAWRAGRSARRQLAATDGIDICLTPAPRSPLGGAKAISAITRRTGATCLGRATVMQHWHAANGRYRDVVIGVSAPSTGFAAHAWLDGDPHDPSRHTEIARRPPPQP